MLWRFFFGKAVPMKCTRMKNTTETNISKTKFCRSLFCFKPLWVLLTSSFNTHPFYLNKQKTPEFSYSNYVDTFYVYLALIRYLCNGLWMICYEQKWIICYELVRWREFFEIFWRTRDRESERECVEYLLCLFLVLLKRIKKYLGTFTLNSLSGDGSVKIFPAPK